MLPAGAEVIDYVAARLPEFGPVIDRLDAEEDGELGAFQAMNELGRWWQTQGSDPELLERILQVVDSLYCDGGMALSRDLAIEFFEWVCSTIGCDRAQSDALSSASSEWFATHGW